MQKLSKSLVKRQTPTATPSASQSKKVNQLTMGFSNLLLRAFGTARGMWARKNLLSRLYKLDELWLQKAGVRDDDEVDSGEDTEDTGIPEDQRATSEEES